VLIHETSGDNGQPPCLSLSLKQRYCLAFNNSVRCPGQLHLHRRVGDVSSSTLCAPARLRFNVLATRYAANQASNPRQRAALSRRGSDSRRRAISRAETTRGFSRSPFQAREDAVARTLLAELNEASCVGVAQDHARDEARDGKREERARGYKTK